jgi:hypothetical protein
MKINLDFGGVAMSGCLFDTDDIQGSISVAVDMDIVSDYRAAVV